jgi:rhodanese-related sulfurtransferase
MRGPTSPTPASVARRGGRSLYAPVFVMSLVILAIAVVGCAGTYTTIPPDEVQQRLASDPDVFLLDVRTQGEYDSGHIPGATLIPVQELKFRLAEVPKNRTVIVYCLSGERSAEAAAMLSGEGYGDVYNMGQGVQAWRGPFVR